MVGFCFTLHNSSAYLKYALTSLKVIAKKINDELNGNCYFLFIDDYSAKKETDAHLELIKEYLYPEYQDYTCYIKNTINQGVFSNLNKALKHFSRSLLHPSDERL